MINLETLRADVARELPRIHRRHYIEWREEGKWDYAEMTRRVSEEQAQFAIARVLKAVAKHAEFRASTGFVATIASTATEAMFRSGMGSIADDIRQALEAAAAARGEGGK